MIFKKRTAVIMAIVLCFCAAAISATVFRGEGYITASIPIYERPVIILDAGHAALENTIDS